jgi:hypothetical protein
MFFKDVGMQNACRFVACLVFFILVMSSLSKRIITERRPLSCSTSTGMTALTTHFYSAPASSSLSDFDRGWVCQDADPDRMAAAMAENLAQLESSDRK